MKCVHTFGTGRHKRQADITLLFEYISDDNVKFVFENREAKCYLGNVFHARISQLSNTDKLEYQNIANLTAIHSREQIKDSCSDLLCALNKLIFFAKRS